MMAREPTVLEYFRPETFVYREAGGYSRKTGRYSSPCLA
jgi:hypothetical protein